MGLTELQTCSSIPTKVTLNEYIEISKFYSTPKSNLFINGVLDKAIIQLTKDKKIVKIGRGLIS
jgi:N utilization substance protein B